MNIFGKDVPCNITSSTLLVSPSAPILVYKMDICDGIDMEICKEVKIISYIVQSVCLFIYDLFNDIVSNSYYIASNDCFFIYYTSCCVYRFSSFCAVSQHVDSDVDNKRLNWICQ
jgi:hypothetical protein